MAGAVAQITLADGDAARQPSDLRQARRARQSASRAATSVLRGRQDAIGGGVWFGKADAHSEFVVAEGVESTLSAACACPTSRRASRP